MEDKQWLENFDGFDIKPCEFKLDLDDKSKFVKLGSGSAAKMQISSFAQHLPEIAIVGAMNDIYVATFTSGVPHVLAQLKDGSGYFGSIRNPETGRFIGTAALNPIGGYAVVAAAFTAMSIVTSQYYLTEINGKLNKIQQGVDKILDFLYGEKRAELMSEVVFAKYAYENYISIMAHEEQRIATISGLQDTKKIAMKDLEFYISDLDCLSRDMGKDIPEAARRALRLKDSLDLSAQLYVMSGLMETYYSQNTDENYISYVENEMTSYLDKSEKHILQDFAAIANPIMNYKGKGLDSSAKKRIEDTMNELNGGEESKLRKSLREALRASENKSEYYIKTNGDIYMRAKP